MNNDGICLIILCIIGYFYIEIKFPELIECTAEATVMECNCIKRTITQNTSFTDKVRMILKGASREELLLYIGVEDSLACTLISNKYNAN
ncbi:MAG: hypothetical protein IKW39_01810 [Alphaproteobacteria bacterium]|nr:hypothetical protein [Alphaproteobacteria bacterium]